MEALRTPWQARGLVSKEVDPQFDHALGKQVCDDVEGNKGSN